MTELTPERIRDAAEVLETWATGGYTRTVRELRDHADKLEREQAAEVERERRAEQLTDEMLIAAYPGVSMPPVSAMQAMSRAARSLLDRYPTLGEQPNCGHPNHGNDDHDCAPTLDFQARNAR